MCNISEKRNSKFKKSFFWGYDYLFAFALIAITTIIFHFARGYFAKGQWALLYLLVIMAVANKSGIKGAIFTSFMAFFAWNYFLIPPYFTLRVGDLKDWLFLFVFLAVGLIVGLQTGRLKAREKLALSREHESDLLNKFSARLVSDLSLKDLAEFLAKETQNITNAKSVIVYLPDLSEKLKCISLQGQAVNDEQIKLVNWSYSHSKIVGLNKKNEKSISQYLPDLESYKSTISKIERNDIFFPLLTSNRRLGVLYISEKENGEQLTFQEFKIVIAMANQASAFLERKKLQKIAIEAKSREKADKFKSVIVSSIQHELKTPLASINATVSNLLENDVQLDPDNVHEELNAIQDDLHRLNGSIGSLVELSRLESADWEPKKDWYEFGEILSNSLSRLSKKHRNRVTFDLENDLELYVDFIQIARVMQIIIENALVYSKKNVLVGAITENKKVKIRIEDKGPGIDIEDKKHIFDKFYRGRNSAGTTGTGLGLAIALEIVKFHGGDIKVENVTPHGSCFELILPARKRNYWE